MASPCHIELVFSEKKKAVPKPKPGTKKEKTVVAAKK